MRKQTHIMTLLIAVLLILSACSNTQEPAATLEVPGISSPQTSPVSELGAPRAIAGTYKASGKGYAGDVVLNVEFSDIEIIRIDIEDHNETEAIGGAAIKALAQQVMSSQNAAPDIISGATYSSNAFLSALQECVSQADGDSLFLQDIGAVPESEPVSLSADVVIVGAGGAGMAAAASAMQNGGSVIILEKMPMIGGNTVRSEGGFSFTDPDVTKTLDNNDALEKVINDILAMKPYNEEFSELQDTVKKEYAEYKKSGAKHLFDSKNFFALQMLHGGDGKGLPELVKTFAQNATDTLYWIAKIGDYDWLNIGRVSTNIGIGSIYPRGGLPYSKDGTTRLTAYQSIIKPLEAYVRDGGGQIYLSTTATELIEDNGRIVGVNAVGSNGAEYTVMANKGVVLATGGYGANPEMVKQYNDIPVTLSASAAGVTGDGLIMAQKVGAALEGMDYIQIHPHGMPKTGNTNSTLAGSDTTDVVFVNLDGKRFVNENERRDNLSYAVLGQREEMFFSIYDRAYVERVTLPGKAGDPVEEAVLSGDAFKGETLEELAKAVGIDSDTFITTIEGYNNTVENGAQIDFPKTTYGNTISVAPFYAVPLKVTIHYCMGGVRITPQTQVVNEQNQAISGLYAAGEVTGGVHGSNRLGGCSLTDLMVFGRIAGQEVMK